MEKTPNQTLNAHKWQLILVIQCAYKMTERFNCMRGLSRSLARWYREIYVCLSCVNAQTTQTISNYRLFYEADQMSKMEIEMAFSSQNFMFILFRNDQQIYRMFCSGDIHSDVCEHMPTWTNIQNT